MELKIIISKHHLSYMKLGNSFHFLHHKTKIILCLLQIGFPQAVQVHHSSFPGGDPNYLLDDLQCDGTERTLLECPRYDGPKNNSKYVTVVS